MDYLFSRDIQDIISVIDGRSEIIDEIDSGTDELKEFLGQTFRNFLVDPAFIDSLPGHLLPDNASQSRLPLLTARIEAIAQFAS